jgi:hypothetical protein
MASRGCAGTKLEGKVERDSDEMNPSARRVIELARAARTPGVADKRRVRQALAFGIGATVAGVSSGTAIASAAKAGAIVGVRAIVAAVLLVSAGAGTFLWVRGRAPAPAAPSVAAPLAPAAVPPPTVVPLDPLLAELTLLRRAQQALRDGAARRALELAERHAILYPDSQLGLERGALRVFAFCALGRKSEARALSTKLLAAAPRSPLRTSLEESCATR